MVKIEEFVNLSFIPVPSKKNNEYTFSISGAVGNQPWRELRITYNFNNAKCKLEFLESIEDKMVLIDKWKGKVMSMAELEGRIQELN